MYATLEWPVPSVNFTIGWLTKGMLCFPLFFLLDFNLGWLTKGVLYWIGSFLHKKYTIGLVTKRM